MSEISFSGEVRKEICQSINDSDKKFACLYGMILFSRTVSDGHICFQTESSVSSEIFGRLIKSVFGKKAEPQFREHKRKNGSTLYTYEITDSIQTAEIIRTYRINTSGRRIDSEMIRNNSLGVFAAGVFLACGSVNDPSKEYHLEFCVPETGLAEDLVSLLGGLGMSYKTVLRRSQPVVYVKDSESIEDTLTFIGAQQCTLELMNVKIYKDVRNKANRITNCDAANIDKVVNAAMKQIEDILLIDRETGLDELSDELREVAQLRLENTDMSLKEIGESLTVPISRSGVNHRFQKLAAMADEIRSGRVKKNES